MAGLTLKQKLFVEHYLRTKNGVESARLAGYSGNDATLRAAASENLTKPNIAKAIEDRLEPLILSADRVLEGLTRIAESDIADLFRPDGSFDLAEAKKRGVSRLIKSLSFDKDTGRVTKVEMYSAHEAYRDMGKHRGLFPTQIKIIPVTDADKAIDQACEQHGIPRPETFGGEPVATGEM